MRTKSFILTFLMMMFCSIGFGQASHWGVPDTHCESTMTMITQIVVDGTIRGADVEIAAFCGDKLRGTVRPDETQMNMVYLVIHGNIPTAGDPAEVISFRFYDHSAGRELFYPYPDIVFEDNKKIGDIEFLNTQTGIYAGDNLIDFTSIAEVNNVKYGILQEAVNAAQAGETVTLLQSAIGAGVVIDKNVTIDFGGKTYTVNQAVGSAGTETLGFQILKNKTVTLNNGTLTSTAAVEGSKEVKMLIQNYAHLTLNKMNLVDNTDHILYALSNNSGNVNLVGKTNITTNAVAFDVYDYSSAGYDVPTVNVNTTGIIDGKIEVSESISNNLNISGGLFTAQIAEAWCADGYIPTTEVVDGTTYNTVKEGEYVARNTTTGQGYETLVEAVEAATAGQTVELIADATGAGLKINKNITVDLGGFTYTINQAVGSTGTESQGFQLLKNNTVTLKNGNIAIAENTNVKWMFNAYADVTLENLNVNCANMAAPAENEANYVLVVNNGGSATPTVTYTNVTVTNFPSTATAQIWLDPTTTLKAGEGLEDSIETEEGYVVVYNNGEYTAIAGNVLNETTNIKYATLAEAIAAATAGDKLVLLADITENVTVNKNLTIDGANAEGGKFDYTGTMTANNGLTVTVQNIDFVGGRFTKETKSTSGTYTFKNCTFDGNNNTLPYALRFKGATKVTVEDCTVKNYLYSFLYIANAATTVNVKNVTVEDCPDYAVYFASGVTNSTIENLTVKNSDNGIVYNNTANRAFNLKDCTFENVATAINAAGNGDKSITCNMSGTNDFGTSVLNQYAKIVLTAADATLEATEGLNVTTNVADHIVDYADGKYYLRVPNYVAAIGETKYESLQAAIDAAVDGDEVVVLENIDLSQNELGKLDGSYDTYFKVEGKTVTIDLNGKTISGAYTGTGMLVGVFSTENNGHLTLKDTVGTAEVNVTAIGSVYSLIANYEPGSSIIINNGTYILDAAIDSHVYSGGSAGVNEGVTINGGLFKLGNVGTGTNGKPWIFNVLGANDGYINVNGGTFKADVNHQYWAYEVNVPATLALNDNGDGTWTVVPAVAQGTDSWKGYNRSLGYASIADAAHWATAETTVTVVADRAITETAIVESNITLDFAGKEVTCSANPAIRIQGNVNVTVKNGNMNTEGYNFILGASDGSSAGNLTIESGKFHGTTTVASVTKGNLNITGGEFSVEPYQGNNYAYLINCIDSYYNSGDATVSISGGTFHNWNPENNAAEGAGTNFCATGYMAEKIECEHGDCYKVIEGVYVAQVGETKYKTVAAAVAAATAGGTVTLIANVTEDVTISKNLTIDGAGKNYTGNISVDNSDNSNVVATVKNVNFVNGTGYAVTTNRIKSITVENCTVTNYGYGFLYANKTTPTVVVKNVTVDGGNYGFHWVYGTTATLENVTMTNVTNGLYIQNYASKTINLKNCVITKIGIWEREGKSGVQTFNFEGANTVGTLTGSQYAKYVLTAADATLTAPEGSTVTTTVDGYKVAYEDGKYCLKPCDYVAEIVGGAKYESLQAAIDAAQNGNEIDLIKSIYVTEVNNDNTTEILVSGGVSYRALYTVSGKSVTIDLNDSILYSTAVAADFLYNVFAVANGGHLTIKTDGPNGHGQVINEAASSVYSLLFCYDGTMTIENGNYNLKNGGNGRGMIYSQQDETVTVNGGKFILGNVGELDNGSPWIFNASGQNTKNIIVNGGTFNDDILHQYYPFEVMAQKEKALKYDADKELWTMVDAVAYVDEQHKSGNYYTNEVGYATLEEAVAARKYNENADHVMTVTLLKEIDLGNTTLLVDSDEDYKNSNINFDFAEKDVEGSLTPAIRIQGGANVTIKNGKMNTTGYNFILGASDGSSAGNLTIESGTYTGTVTVASVTKGLLTIKGGVFKVNESEYGATYMINCIDANYNADPRTANVEIYGGTFYGFNPQDNAAETGGHTNFCAEGYGAVETSANVWEVTPAQVITFETKWNWVSHYVVGNTDSDILAQLQNGLGAYGVQIKNQNYFTDYGTDPQGNTGWFGPLSNTSVTDMYKVNTSLASGESLPIQLTGAVVDPTQYPIEFAVNWNYIGYPLNESVNVETVFSGFAENGDYIKSRDQFAEYYDGMWWGDLRSMNPGEGYMYQRSTAETFTYSYPSTREAVKANVTSENNYWVPASSQYADNMTMVAMLDVKGGDYEVAAFVGGEVRGSSRPVYIESLDAYMFFLTIHGDEVEEMTFKVYDLATGEEYDLNNRMNYSNDAVVGSIGNPYLLSRGTTGIGESALTEVNIYPNPTTTGREVNLGSVCDTVEVFNALGVKIAEYTNVDTIDALETAGIYVIRITNDGNVQNCRLIVK